MHNYYTHYYTFQEGSGSVEDNQFLQLKLPRVYQRGNGVGGVFSSIWRFLQPIFKSGANFLKKEITETGFDLIKGINEQKPMNEILRDRSLKVVDNLRDATAAKIKKMTGSGRKRKHATSSSAIKRKSKRSKHQSISTIKGDKRRAVKSKRNTTKKPKIKPRILDIFSE